MINLQSHTKATRINEKTETDTQNVFFSGRNSISIAYFFYNSYSIPLSEACVHISESNIVPFAKGNPTDILLKKGKNNPFGPKQDILLKSSL